MRIKEDIPAIDRVVTFVENKLKNSPKKGLKPMSKLLLRKIKNKVTVILATDLRQQVISGYNLNLKIGTVVDMTV